jgi:antimicrobial peptide system SdpA family protein
MTDEDARLGRRIAAAGLAGFLMAFAVFVAALPATPFTPPGAGRVRAVAPQGWGFFTRNPRLPSTMPYGRAPDGGWRSLHGGPRANPKYLMGLDRQPRAAIMELDLLRAQVPQRYWSACDRDPAACLAALPAGPTVVNSFPRHTVCGDVALVDQEVLPWAWHGTRTTMPSMVVRITSIC